MLVLDGALEEERAPSPLRSKDGEEMFKVPLFANLSAQQRIIFSASSNNSARRCSEAARVLLGNASPSQLQEASSFGENQNFKAPGSVPFKWEEQPGKPKSPSSLSYSSSPGSSPLSFLQPPPCLSIGRTQQQQGLSPRLAERIKNILQLRLASPLRSPISLSKDSNSAGEMRSSPVSILDASVFGASPESYSSSSPSKRCSSSSAASSRANFLEHHAVESPLSSGRFKKQLSLEIWDRSLRESSSSSTGCGFFKNMLGCWKLQHKLVDHDTCRGSSLENYREQHHQDFSSSDHVLGGEFESFKERSYDDDVDCGGGSSEFDHQSRCFYDEVEALEMAEAEMKQPADEVHAVDDGKFATFPVSAAFVFSKPALKKSGVVADRKLSKRVRFLIEDYSSDDNNEPREKSAKNKADDMFDDAISTEDEGFQRPVRSVIRRRKKKNLNSSTSKFLHSPQSLEEISISPGAQATLARYGSFEKASRETFHAIATFDLDAVDSSPDLQPMKDVAQRPPPGGVLRFTG
ncbi:hypothetical protein SELMODRAFT_446370 [Selaginella moellendorffii]|uniref:Uncharacterized protein n=1 Tax=Selaginella moellendorffii TaxID=88036 RepID=D8SQU8_SELML|nr:uncharacterized protein LOC9653598 [Selaginella moellendorffii]EFJ13231.1 hypothetical protein SELMODRAFT_446370 [Selaginella moellendorffii]|eukprot:XP_002985653.1 uncharacterized protein LOC9653598 [Selaginella moellendorffii]